MHRLAFSLQSESDRRSANEIAKPEMHLVELQTQLFHMVRASDSPIDDDICFFYKILSSASVLASVCCSPRSCNLPKWKMWTHAMCVNGSADGLQWQRVIATMPCAMIGWNRRWFCFDNTTRTCCSSMCNVHTSNCIHIRMHQVLTEAFIMTVLVRRHHSPRRLRQMGIHSLSPFVCRRH